MTDKQKGAEALRGLEVTYTASVGAEALEAFLRLRALQERGGKGKPETLNKLLSVETSLRVAGKYLRIDSAGLLNAKGMTLLYTPSTPHGILLDHATASTRSLASAFPPPSQRTDTGKPLSAKVTHHPGETKGRFGPEQEVLVEVATETGALKLLVRLATDPPNIAVADLRRVNRALFAFAEGEAALHALRSLPGLVVSLQAFVNKERQAVATTEITQIADYLFAADDFTVPTAYHPETPADTRAGFNLPLREHFSVRRDIEVGTPGQVVFVDLAGTEVDAGIALSPRFFTKAGRVASSITDVLNPQEHSSLTFTVDWYRALEERLGEVGRVDLDNLDTAVDIALGILFERRLGEVDTLEDFPELADLLTDAQRDELNTLLATRTGTYWTNFADTQTRRDLTRRYFLAVLVPPIAADLRPQIDYDTPVTVFQELDDAGQPVEDSGFRVVRLSFFEDREQLYAYHFLELMNFKVFDFHPSLTFAEDVLPEVEFTDRGVRLRLNNDALSIGFSFWTQPAGTWQSLLAAILTFGVSYAALWNYGWGSYGLGDSDFVYRLEPRPAGRGRIRQRLRFLEDESRPDSGFFFMGINPLQWIPQWIISLIVTWFNGGTREIGTNLAAGVNEVLRTNEVLSFPAMFTCGNPTVPDRATRFLQRPERADVALSPTAAYYHGVYGLSSDVTPEAFDDRLPFDGAYVFHKEALGALVSRRLSADGRTLPVALPDVAAAPHSVYPDFIKDATLFDSALLDSLQTAGFMDDSLRADWDEYLLWRRPWLAFLGYPNNEIPLSTPPGGTLRTFLEAHTEVSWTPGLSSLPSTQPLGSVTLTLTCHHVFDLLFMTENALELRQFLRFYEENYWAELPFPASAELPPRVASLPLFSTEVTLQGSLFVGLWDQGRELTPGFPASFDFAVRNLGTPQNGATTVHGGASEYTAAARAALVREAARAALVERGEGLARPLAHRGRYLSIELPEMRLGLHWRVTNPDATELLVRTTNDHLYLDFSLDTLIVDNLES